MRLLLCCEFYYPSVGGVQEVMRQLAERFVQRGHEVIVATTRLENRTSRLINGVKIEEFGIVGNAVRGMRGEIQRYRDFVVNARVDAILIKAAQQWTFDALWPVLGEIKARKVFIPCGFSGFYEASYKRYFEKLPDVLKYFDHLIFYAEKYRDIDFAREHEINNFSIIPNGASEIEFSVDRDPSFRQRYGIAEDSFVFLTVGSLTGHKGHLELTRAFYRLNPGKRKVFLILNGNDTKMPEILTPRYGEQDENVEYESGYQKSLLQRIGRYPRIIWEAYSNSGWRGLLVLTGSVIQRRYPFLFILLKRTFFLRLFDPLHYWVTRISNGDEYKKILLTDLSRNELVQAYKNANLFVFASNIEYSPLVLFESAAAGLPFLTVNVGNSEEIAEWTGCGIICPAVVDEKGYTRVDPKVFAMKMQELMNKPDLLERLGQAGHERWVKKFSWAKIVIEYENILAGTG